MKSLKYKFYEVKKEFRLKIVEDKRTIYKSKENNI